MKKRCDCTSRAYGDIVCGHCNEKRLGPNLQNEYNRIDKDFKEQVEPLFEQHGMSCTPDQDDIRAAHLKKQLAEMEIANKAHLEVVKMVKARYETMKCCGNCEHFRHDAIKIEYYPYYALVLLCERSYHIDPEDCCDAWEAREDCKP